MKITLHRYNALVAFYLIYTNNLMVLPNLITL